MANDEKKLVEYTVNFVGVTGNQAQAIEGVIMSIKKLKAKDELPMRKYQGEVEERETDLVLFKDGYTFISQNGRDLDLLKRFETRINKLETEIAERELKIDGHKANLDYIDAYIGKIRSNIKEQRDDEKHIVTFTYNTEYFEPFLDLANIVFEISVEEPDSKVN